MLNEQSVKIIRLETKEHLQVTFIKVSTNISKE